MSAPARKKGLRTLGAVVLALAAALPIAAGDKPLTIQEKREAVFSKIMDGNAWSKSVEYGEWATSTRNRLVWDRSGVSTALEVVTIDSSYRQTPRRLLDLDYFDSRTRLEVRDADADGLGPRDSFYLQRYGQNGSRASLWLHYLDDGAVDVMFSVHKTDGKESGAWFTTNGLNPFVRWRMRKPLNAVLKLGTDMYASILDDVLAGRPPSLPIAELDRAFDDAAPFLWEDAGDKFDAMLALAKSYERELLTRANK